MQALPWDLWFAATGLPAGLTVDLTFDEVAGTLSATLANRGDAIVRPGLVRMEAEVDSPAAGGRTWLDAGSGDSPSIEHEFGAPWPAGYADACRRETGDVRAYTSSGVVTVALVSRQTPVLLAGAVRMDRFPLAVSLEVEGDDARLVRLVLEFDLEGASIAPGETLELPPVALAEGHDAEGLRETYAEKVALAMSAREPSTIPTLWYGTPGGDFDSQLAQLQAVVTRLPVDFAVYDAREGGAASPGDEGELRAFAEGARALGVRAGIVSSPFLVPSPLAADTPGVLRTVGGAPVLVERQGSTFAVIDATHPEGEARLREAVQAPLGAAGAAFFEVEDCAVALQAAGEVAYHRTGTTGTSHLRRGLEIIRETVGDGVFLSLADCPFGVATGIADAVHATGGDGTGQAARLLQRGWLHGRWWLAHPGTALSGGPDEIAQRRNATAVALSGAIVALAGEAAEAGMPAFAAACGLAPSSGAAATAVTHGPGPAAAGWRCSFGRGRAAAGIVNWGSEAAWAPWSGLLKAGEVAFDFWNARPLPMGDLFLRPGEAALWQVFATAGTPALVGDSGHIACAGLIERQVSGRLQLRNTLGTARVVAIRSRGQVWTAELGPGESRWFD